MLESRSCSRPKGLYSSSPSDASFYAAAVAALVSLDRPLRCHADIFHELVDFVDSEVDNLLDLHAFQP
ncbi:hypothetical protein ACE6H2_005567 [Prunus campanulata]